MIRRTSIRYRNARFIVNSEFYQVSLLPSLKCCKILWQVFPTITLLLTQKHFKTIWLTKINQALIIKVHYPGEEIAYSIFAPCGILRNALCWNEYHEHYGHPVWAVNANISYTAPGKKFPRCRCSWRNKSTTVPCGGDCQS